MRRHDLVQLLTLGLGCTRAEDRIAGHESSVIVADLTQPEWSEAHVRRRAACAASVGAVAGKKCKIALFNGAAGEKTGVWLVVRSITVFSPSACFWSGQVYESPKGTGTWAENAGNWIDTRISARPVGVVGQDNQAVAVLSHIVSRHTHTETSHTIEIPVILRPGWCLAIGGSVDNTTMYADVQWDEIDVTAGV